jgi:hypothetical protein
MKSTAKKRNHVWALVAYILLGDNDGPVPPTARRLLSSICFALGVKVTNPTYMFRDNLGVVQNITMKDSLLKKKHVAISYHKGNL